MLIIFVDVCFFLLDPHCDDAHTCKRATKKMKVSSVTLIPLGSKKLTQGLKQNGALTLVAHLSDYFVTKLLNSTFITKYQLESIALRRHLRF